MEKEELKDIEFMLCDCESIEHQITLRKDDELKDIYMKYTSSHSLGTNVLSTESNTSSDTAAHTAILTNSS